LARGRYELWGESVREIGVLILVFVPVDAMFELMKDGKFDTHNHWIATLVAAGIGFGLIIIGAEIERKR
jgi:hypothetical protein